MVCCCSKNYIYGIYYTPYSCDHGVLTASPSFCRFAFTNYIGDYNIVRYMVNGDGGVGYYAAGDRFVSVTEEYKQFSNDFSGINNKDDGNCRGGNNWGEVRVFESYAFGLERVSDSVLRLVGGINNNYKYSEVVIFFEEMVRVYNEFYNIPIEKHFTLDSGGWNA